MLSLETGLTRVEGVAFHPPGNLVAAGGRGVELWDVRTMEPVWQVGWEIDYVKQFGFTADGRCLVALVPEQGRVYLLDIVSGTCARFYGEFLNISLAVSPADGRVVTGADTFMISAFPSPPRSAQMVRPVIDWEQLASDTAFKGRVFTPPGDLLLTHEVPHE